MCCPKDVNDFSLHHLFKWTVTTQRIVFSLYLTIWYWWHLHPVTAKVCSLIYVSRWISTDSYRYFYTISGRSGHKWLFVILHSSFYLTDASYFQHCLKIPALVPGLDFILLCVTEDWVQHITALIKTYLTTNITESESSLISHTIANLTFLKII